MNKEVLARLANAPVYGWESGIRTSTPATQNFYDNYKEFYAVKTKDNCVMFFSLDGDLLLTTSPIIKLEKKGGYVRIETRNSVFSLWTSNYEAPVTTIKPIFTDPKVVEIKSIDVKEVYSKICAQYPYAGYGSYRSAFNDARNDNFVTDDEYEAAHAYYNRLWDYAGD